MVFAQTTPDTLWRSAGVRSFWFFAACESVQDWSRSGGVRLKTSKKHTGGVLAEDRHERYHGASASELILVRESHKVPPTRLNLFLIAAFCRLAKSLSHFEQMGWLVGAVGIESTTLLETKEFCDAARPSKVLKGKGGNS